MGSDSEFDDEDLSAPPRKKRKEEAEREKEIEIIDDKTETDSDEEQDLERVSPSRQLKRKRPESSVEETDSISSTRSVSVNTRDTTGDGEKVEWSDAEDAVKILKSRVNTLKKSTLKPSKPAKTATAKGTRRGKLPTTGIGRVHNRRPQYLTSIHPRRLDLGTLSLMSY